MRHLRRKSVPLDETLPPSTVFPPVVTEQAPIPIAPSQPDKDYHVMRLHLGSHTAAHSIFESSGLHRREELAETFRDRILALPQSQVVDVITAIQACIDGCYLDTGPSGQRLRLLQDICSLSRLLPKVYWIEGVSRGRRIGFGGEATVYKARHDGRDVVVREFHPPPQNDWNVADGHKVFKLIVREVIAHWQLQHPNVVSLLGIYQPEDDEEGPPSMVLQFAEYASAQLYLKAHPDSQSFLKVVKGLLDGLCYLHSRSPAVIHGDLHDQNILVTSAGDALLCDFGLSRIRHEVTRTHTTLRQGGRLRYIAPELSAGPENFRINESSDIYSLAMTIYTLGTGLKPFHEFGSDFAASRAAEAGTRPSKFPRSTPPDLTLIHLGGLTDMEWELVWSQMTHMWDQDPLSRPSVFIVRRDFALNGLIPLPPLPPIDPNSLYSTFPATYNAPFPDVNSPPVKTELMDEETDLRDPLGTREVFEITTICTDLFTVPSLQGSALPQSSNKSDMYAGWVTCSVPLEATNGTKLVAVGSAEGVWIGLRYDSKSLRKVLYLKNVTQCAMLEEFGIFLVLANQCLFAYHIETLVPSGAPAPKPSREPQRLSKNWSVQFFSVGRLNGRTSVIYMKKKGLDSIFRVLEPVPEKFTERSSSLASSFFGTSKSEWFREYKEFFLPFEAHDLIFLKTKVAILGATTFEIMDLAEWINERNTPGPSASDPSESAIPQRYLSRKPMGMFRSAENEFLLCFDQFGLYVNRHGEVSNRPTSVVEWQGTAQRVAFYAPYLVIFDIRHIEVRHISTADLVQIIEGTDVYCTFDGRGYLSRSDSSVLGPTTSGPAGGEENAEMEDVHIHGVMKSTAVPRATFSQHVFALTPKELLYSSR